MNSGDRTTPSASVIWRKAALIWLVLGALLAASIISAFLPLGTTKLAVLLGLSAINALIVTILFMGLRHDGAVIRLTALAGILWLAVLITLVIIESATRHHGLSVFG